MALALRISSISTSLKFVSGVGSDDEGSSRGGGGGGSAREGRLVATDLRRNTRPARRSLASFEAPVA